MRSNPEAVAINALDFKPSSVDVAPPVGQYSIGTNILKLNEHSPVQVPTFHSLTTSHPTVTSTNFRML